MLDVADTVLEMENGSVALVRCKRCHERIGRVQVRPPNEGEDPHVWEDEVRGELEVLAAEHELLCPERRLSSLHDHPPIDGGPEKP